jgi:hypothetical protein
MQIWYVEFTQKLTNCRNGKHGTTKQEDSPVIASPNTTTTLSTLCPLAFQITPNGKEPKTTPNGESPFLEIPFALATLTVLTLNEAEVEAPFALKILNIGQPSIRLSVIVKHCIFYYHSKRRHLLNANHYYYNTKKNSKFAIL